jgi:aryl-alcohol dehydrogenase-like predicted oxidoreductase
MRYTTLGKTGLRVSVAGLGCGGFSRLGLPAGKTEDQAADLVLEAVDLGINFLDTAPAYGTEATVGKALKKLSRDKVVVATKVHVLRNGEWYSADRVTQSIDSSLKLLGTDYIDLFQLHGVGVGEYDHAINVVLPALLAAKEKGKIRHLGITEAPTEDFTHEMLMRAANEGVWEVFMVAFHMMHQSARKKLFPLILEKKIATLLMFAVRSIFAKNERVVAALKEAATQGKISKTIADIPEPLGFLLHKDGGASSITEAAYRFAMHEPGVDIVLFGTGDRDHLHANVKSLLMPPLPAADTAKLTGLFGTLIDVGMDSAPMQQKK